MWVGRRSPASSGTHPQFCQCLNFKFKSASTILRWCQIMGLGTRNSPGCGVFPDNGQILGWPLSSGGATEPMGHLEVAFQLDTWTSCTKMLSHFITLQPTAAKQGWTKLGVSFKPSISSMCFCKSYFCKTGFVLFLCFAFTAEHRVLKSRRRARNELASLKRAWLIWSKAFPLEFTKWS